MNGYILTTVKRSVARKVLPNVPAVHFSKTDTNAESVTKIVGHQTGKREYIRNLKPVKSWHVETVKSGYCGSVRPTPLHVRSQERLLTYAHSAHMLSQTGVIQESETTSPQPAFGYIAS